MVGKLWCFVQWEKQHFYTSYEFHIHSADKWSSFNLFARK